MSFFYDLNKRLADLASKQDAKQISEDAKASAPKSQLAEALEERATGDYGAKKARAGKDIGKPGKAFAQIAKSAGERYGSKERGEKVAGAVLAKLRHPKEDIADEGNAFTGALKATPKGGKFNVGGKEFTDTSSIEEVEMTPKQKSFAKLAPPTDKITFADKIAGAKQEVDEMLGDVAADAIKRAIKGHKGEITKTAKGLKHRATSAYGGAEDEPHPLDRLKGPKAVKEMERSSSGGEIHRTATGLRHVAKDRYAGMDDEEADDFDDETPKTKGRPKGTGRAIGAKVTGTSKLHRQDAIAEDDIEEGYAEMDAWLKSREKEKGTGKFDVKDTGYSKRYTRKLADEPESDDEASDTPKQKGRPVGSRRAIGAKVKGTSKLHRQDAIAEEEHVCEMCGQAIVAEKAPPGAKAERMVKHIKKSLSKDGKLSDKDKAIAYATTWKAHKAGKVEEESTDKEDQKAERAGKKVAKDIEHDEGHKAKGDNKAERAGKKVTKDIEYDDKKDKEEKVDETTTSGSVATAPASAPKSSKGMQFGKGVYESLDSQFKQALTEGMNVSVNLNSDAEGDAQKSITVTATGSDADKLAELLKMAGIEQKQPSCGCGSEPCSCDEELDENSPDWPTNTEEIDAEPNLRTYSGGLNGPKSTGQTTTPVIASQLRRQVSMEESVELERTLFKTWSKYKG